MHDKPIADYNVIETCAAAITQHSLSQMKPAGFAQSKNQIPGWLSPVADAPGGSVCCSTRPHTLVSLSGTYCSKKQAKKVAVQESASA
jgi:hypothetical protein